MKKLTFFLFFTFILNFTFATGSKSSVQPSMPDNAFVTELYTNNPNNIVLGNPNGSITVVEIYDYNCMYCKLLAGELDKLIIQDKNIRLVRVPVGILADSSTPAAKYAIAAQMQGKFNKVDYALMRAKNLVMANLDNLAKQSGLDMVKLQADLNSIKLADKLIMNDRIVGFSFLMTDDTGLPMTVVAKTTAPHTNVLIGGNNIDKIKNAITSFSSGDKLSQYYPKTHKGYSCSGE